MTVEQKKLQTLQKAYELDEQKVLEEKRRIEEVVEQRRQAVIKLQDEDRKIGEQLKELVFSQRLDALARGDSARLASLSQYELRLREQTKVVLTELAEKNRELEMALSRATLVEDEVVAARVERKKLERLLDSRERSSRIIDAAQEEASGEELDFFRRRK